MRSGNGPRADPMHQTAVMISKAGGAEGNRTPDLCSAIAALSHLSYSPAPSQTASARWDRAFREAVQIAALFAPCNHRRSALPCAARRVYRPSPEETPMARAWHLKSRPQGTPTADNFALEATKLPKLGEGMVHVANRWLSVDPYMRGRMND